MRGNDVVSPDVTGPGDPVMALEDGERVWGALPLTGRIEMLSQLTATLDEHAAEWVNVASEIKRLPHDSPLVGEEWLSGPYPLLESAAALSESLEKLQRRGS